MCFMSNPAGGDSSKQLQTSQGLSNQYNAQAGGVNSELLPFLESEVTNPQGLGDKAVSGMTTKAGEATAGGVGQATEAAQLLGSRTGNTAVTPGIIDAASRDRMKQDSTNALNIDMANNTAKLGQQQAGVAGMGGQYSTDVNAALSALGLGNNAVNAENAAFANSFSGQLADNLGKTLGSPSFSVPCWIAEALWGEADPRTRLVRKWLTQQFKKSMLGAAVVALYVRFGERIAARVRKSAVLRKAFTPIFNKALSCALQWSLG